MTDPKTILNEFYNLCVEARCDFDLYRSLFEEDVNKTELCVNYAPYFFSDINRIIVRTLILQICKLTDPAGSSSKTNLTTNYILQMLPWPTAAKERLTEFNDLLMKFRAKIEPARSKRIAHTDLHSQINQPEPMGQFDKGQDGQFFLDLQTFFDVAYQHVFNERAPAIAVAASTDTYRVIRAIEMAAAN